MAQRSGGVVDQSLPRSITEESDLCNKGADDIFYTEQVGLMNQTPTQETLNQEKGEITALRSQ